ncbi:Uncharacterized protein OBRU01_12968 [Operophtera brumata]|uniref:Uncharacterized protein n=1 Tax=Operophtera brumata TaxID=104452 RepID=A0A0L7KXR7_OPEBR|nr:Uncharacterized protein OBRU01_12968 [Operophtera brumata]
MSHCINCNIAINANQHYNYNVSDMDPDIVAIIEEWIAREILEEDCMCQECIDLIMIELNNRHEGNVVPPERFNNVRRQDLAVFNFRDHVMNINYINLGYSFNEAAAVIDQNELRLIKERCVLFLSEISHEIQKIIPRNLNLLEIIAFFTPDSATSRSSS